MPDEFPAFATYLLFCASFGAVSGMSYGGVFVPWLLLVALFFFVCGVIALRVDGRVR